MSQRIHLPRQWFALRKGWCGQLCLSPWQVPGCTMRIQRNFSVSAPAPRRLQRWQCFDLAHMLASRSGWSSWHSSRNSKILHWPVQGHVPEAKTILQCYRHVTKAHSQWILQNWSLNQHRVDESKVSILVVLSRNFGIQNTAETRWETWMIILEGYILQVEVTCLMASFVKILTIVYYNNFYSIFHMIIVQLNQVFWKGLPEVIYFNLLIREILGRANLSGPCTVNILCLQGWIFHSFLSN